MRELREELDALYDALVPLMGKLTAVEAAIGGLDTYQSPRLVDGLQTIVSDVADAIDTVTDRLAALSRKVEPGELGPV